MSQARNSVDTGQRDCTGVPPFAAGLLEASRAIGRLFEAARDVVLTTHVNPDGDGLGSEAALAAYLQDRGVRVRILNPDPPPRRFQFLATEAAPLGIFRGYEEDRLAEMDLLVALDSAIGPRLGSLAEVLPQLSAARVRIDHHLSTGAPGRPGELELVDPAASSTAELVYRLLRTLEAELTAAVAVPLYVGIAYDTGSFRYANTSRETHLIAADLFGHGVHAQAMYSRLYAVHSLARMRLWGRALSALSIEAGGRLAWMATDRALLAETGATEEDLDGLVEQGRAVEGVELSILFREEGPLETKVSFRSHGVVDVNALARRFGGGGHRNASGATLRGPRREVIARVLAEARAALSRELPPAGRAPSGGAFSLPGGGGPGA